MEDTVILVTGSNGQIGQELVESLCSKYGQENVIATDIKPSDNFNSHFEILDILDKSGIETIIDKYKVTQIYHLAALLSSKGEQNPRLTWKINFEAYLDILEIAREKRIQKIFYPSTIGVFGTTSPKVMTPQHTSILPQTVYGISKMTGELWNQYYVNKYGMDIRGVRYPGVISYKSIPQGGTTDFAVEIFFEALKHKHYQCYLKEDTSLPMIYMSDAIKATVSLMDAPKESLSLSTAYNISSFSVSPSQLYNAIKKYIPEFTIDYSPDNRQVIADSWTESIDDTEARSDWKWNPDYDLESVVKDMLTQLGK